MLLVRVQHHVDGDCFTSQAASPADPDSHRLRSGRVRHQTMGARWLAKAHAVISHKLTR